MLRDLSCHAFADGPDIAVVLDLSGTVVLANDAWSELARASGGGRRCGVGTDYVEVCSTGAAMRAPGAERAHQSVRSVLTGRRTRASSTYPCAGPGGLRWFRSDVFAVRDGDGVCVRHLDITDRMAPDAGADRAAPLPADAHRDDPAGFRDGLAELMRRRSPGHLMVLVCAVAAGRAGGLDERTAGLVHLAVVRLAGEEVQAPARVELSARIGAGEVAVAVSGPTPGAVVGAADRLRATAARQLREGARWGLALASGLDRDPEALIDRARDAVHDPGVVGRGTPVTSADEAARTTALHRSAGRLSDAVAEFDAALDGGLPLLDLVARDQEVLAAERDLVQAATEMASG